MFDNEAKNGIKYPKNWQKKRQKYLKIIVRPVIFVYVRGNSE